MSCVVTMGLGGIMCADCGQVVPTADVQVTTEHSSVCMDCAIAYEYACTECGAVSVKALVSVRHAGMLCEECAADLTIECDDCGAAVLEDLSCHTQGGGQVCEGCLENYTICDDCEEYVYSRDIICGRASAICESCFDAGEYTYCEACQAILHLDRQCYHEPDGCVYCESCLPDDSVIHEYDYTPTVVFHGDDQVHFGVELETDGYSNPSEVAESLIESDENNYYLKEDGSLHNGIEIVFQPRSVDSWLDYAEALQNVCDKVAQHGGRSYNTSTCGLHVHRGRADLTDVQTAKLITAYVRLRSKIERVSQRGQGQYNSYRFVEAYAGNNCKLAYKSVRDKTVNGNKYGALNFRNHSTIEFRTYKGTLKVSSLLGYILFTHYITAWAKHTKIVPLYRDPVRRVWDTFVDYVRNDENKRASKALLDYLVSKGVC